MDTGYYACHYQDNADINDEQNAVKTYVFVQGALYLMKKNKRPGRHQRPAGAIFGRH